MPNYYFDPNFTEHGKLLALYDMISYGFIFFVWNLNDITNNEFALKGIIYHLVTLFRRNCRF